MDIFSKRETATTRQLFFTRLSKSFIFSECRFSTIRLVDTFQKHATTSNQPLRLATWCSSIAVSKSFSSSTTESTKNLDAAATKASETKTPTNLDDFRSREEQREEEFAKQTEDSRTQDEEKIKAVRYQILNASLPFVSTHGWTRDAISKGAESQGFPGVAHGMFPNGGVELIQHFYQQCNQRLVQQLRDDIAAAKDEKPQPIVEFVTNAVRSRLQMIEPYQAHWPQALGIMSLPQNVPTSLAQLLTLIDDICYFAGDRSVDFNWYTRRIGVATIYKMTELYMLQDSSINHQSTWEFLDRRMAEANQLQAVLSMSDEKSRNVSQALTSAFSTARNMLGLNFDRR